MFDTGVTCVLLCVVIHMTLIQIFEGISNSYMKSYRISNHAEFFFLIKETLTKFYKAEQA